MSPPLEVINVGSCKACGSVVQFVGTETIGEVVARPVPHNTALADENHSLRQQLEGTKRWLATVEASAKAGRKHCLLLAKLAADTPRFNSPIDAWEAQAIRDKYLAEVKP